MARFFALSVLVFVALAGVTTAVPADFVGEVPTLKNFCSLFKTTCLDTNVTGVVAYADCGATVIANTGSNTTNMTNMRCREYHLSVASNNTVMTDDTLIKTHCPHAAEVATAPCLEEKLNPVDTNAAFSVSTFSFAALVLALIVASVQL